MQILKEAAELIRNLDRIDKAGEKHEESKGGNTPKPPAKPNGNGKVGGVYVPMKAK